MAGAAIGGLSSVNAVRPGLAPRIAYGWRAPGNSWRREWGAAPSEARLVAMAFGAAFFLTLGPVASEAIAPRLAAGDERLPWFAARLLIGLSFLPLALYVVAGLLGGLCRLFGGVPPDGKGDGEGGIWRAARLALFWSGLVTGPIAVSVHIIAAFAGAATVGAYLAGLVWAAALTAMIAEAMSFAFWRVAIFAACVMSTALALPIVSG